MNARRERFIRAAIQVAKDSGVRGVRKWRTSMTGRAYNTSRQIIAPAPVGPVSFGVFAHECGHIALHRRPKGSKPRWVEETEAWEYALQQMQRHDLPGYERVEADAAEGLRYTYRKAIMRRANPETIQGTYPTWWPRDWQIVDGEVFIEPTNEERWDAAFGKAGQHESDDNIRDFDTG